MHGYFTTGQQPAAGVPDELRRFGVGLSELPGGNRKLIIDERPQGRLYLVMSFELLDTVIRRAELVSILLALIAIYLTTWLTYRASKRLVTPVTWLARQRSEEHTSELQSLMRISYAVFCLKKKKQQLPNQ